MTRNADVRNRILSTMYLAIYLWTCARSRRPNALYHEANDSGDLHQGHVRSTSFGTPALSRGPTVYQYVYEPMRQGSRGQISGTTDGMEEIQLQERLLDKAM
jgi:hypothetical protein